MIDHHIPHIKHSTIVHLLTKQIFFSKENLLMSKLTWHISILSFVVKKPRIDEIVRLKEKLLLNT
jgi:hypothetical protein